MSIQLIIANRNKTQPLFTEINQLLADLTDITSDYRNAVTTDKIKSLETTFNTKVNTIYNKLRTLKPIIIENHDHQKLQNILTTLYATTDKFKDINIQRFKRILHITKSEDQLNGKHADLTTVLQQAYMHDNLSYLTNITDNLDQRHLAILELERNVLELHELFKDLAVVVDLQQESLNVIELHVDKAQNFAETGEVELQDAANYQSKSRKMCCWCLIILIIVFGVIFFPIMSLRML